jgi:putative metallohydrolase (TIGR04338 family)
MVSSAMKVNDSNKSKFFRVEREHFPDIHATPPDFRTVQECQDFINQAIHDPVFLRKYPHAADISVFVRPGRAARRINWWREDNSIAVPKAFRRKHLLLHAAAHLVQPQDSIKHGWEFLKLYLALMHRELGKEASDGFRVALKENDISYRKPRRDADNPEFLQMLRERMQSINEQRHRPGS